MITCDVFRTRFHPGTEDRALLEHLRQCDACLSSAVTADGDVLFRSIGGEGVVPPGGLDAFVGDVMREVHLRSTETAMSGQPAAATRRLAIAATVALAIAGATMLTRFDRPAPGASMSVPRAALHSTHLTSRPVVEAYESASATIVEVPTEGVGDVTVVMVFDETLPADL